MTALHSHQLMSIGDVLTLLKPDFSDLTISKIRYLETEGLVEPARTATGYRKYSHHDVARLKFVLTAQRDQYLPLRVIKEQLEALDRGLEPVAEVAGKTRAPRSLSSVDNLASAADFRSAPVLRLTASELLEAAHSSVELLAGCKQYGLIAADVEEFTADDVAILKTATALSGYGIEPRHLRQFKMAAERELGLVEQVIAPMAAAKDPEVASQADDAARDIAALSVGLHTALVRAGLTNISRR